MRVQSFCLLVLLALLAWAKPASAAESYDNCTAFIATLPAVITTQGTWCFNKDLATSISGGDAIAINTNNVTLDCNDFKLGGLAAGSGTTTIGIHANGRANVTVRHCNIRGFYYGLQLFGGSGHTVEDNRFESNTYIGLRADGDGSVIRRNRVFDTGGTIPADSALGIYADATVDVLDNTVSGVAATTGAANGYAIGIEIVANPSGSVSGNRVRGLMATGGGAVRGILVTISDRVILTQNHVIGDASTGSFGLWCPSGPNGSAKDNVVSGFVTAIDTCSDDGGNVVHP